MNEHLLRIKGLSAFADQRHVMRTNPFVTIVLLRVVESLVDLCLNFDVFCSNRMHVNAKSKKEDQC